MTDASLPPARRIRWQNATLTRIVPRTARIKSFFLRLPGPFAHRAGQHVDLRLTAPDGYRAVRSYSIASAPGGSDEIELAIERLDDGEVSPFFHDIAEVGDDIELRGPLGGHFVWSVTDGGPLLLVGGGSGVVPLMAMIRHRQAVAAEVPTLMLLSARSWQDVLYRDELIEIEKRSTGFMLVLALTREAPKRHGDYGRRIDAAMMAEVSARFPAAPKHTFICGSNAFVNAAAAGAITAGVPASRIRTERYGE